MNPLSRFVQQSPVEGWLYLAVILDPYSLRVIGWAVRNRMKRDLAIRALDMAVA